MLKISHSMLKNSQHPRWAGISAFGFGESNFHIILEEYGSRKECIDYDGDIQIVPFSHEKRSGLIESLHKLPKQPVWSEVRRISRQKRSEFVKDHEHRPVFVVENGHIGFDQLVQESLALLQEDGSKQHKQTPNGVFYGHGAFDDQITSLYGGQGAQYPHMFSQLAQRFPQMLESLELGDSMWERYGDLAKGRLSDLIYPDTVFENKEKEEHIIESLKGTDVAQPAIAAVSMGYTASLKCLG